MDRSRPVFVPLIRPYGIGVTETRNKFPLTLDDFLRFFGRETS